MKILFPDLVPKDAFEIYIGNRGRFATMTSVKIINETTLMGCHFWGKKMFLIRFDYTQKTYKIVDSIDTIFKKELVSTDLMDFKADGNKVVVSNLEQGSASVYNFDPNNYKLSFIKDLFGEGWKLSHGVRFVPDVMYDKELVAATFVHPSDVCIRLIDVESNSVYWKICVEKGLIPKDILFIGNSHAVIIYCMASGWTHSRDVYMNSRVDFCELNIREKKISIIDSFNISDAHVDNIAVKESEGNKLIFISIQSHDEIIVLRIEDNKFRKVNSIVGFDFPHGVDIYKNLMAVSNYGNNSIIIKEI